MSDSSITYGMSDLGQSADGSVPAGAVSVGGGHGCGREHAVQSDADGRPYIDCQVCAPYLTGHHYGWSASAAGVPLTPDEQAERELAERDGVAMQRIVLKSVTDSLVTAASAAKSGKAALLDQVKALGADGRAELLALLAHPEHDEPDAPKAPARPAAARPARPRAKG